MAFEHLGRRPWGWGFWGGVLGIRAEALQRKGQGAFSGGKAVRV